jgi:CRP-like cAMP-binding protein
MEKQNLTRLLEELPFFEGFKPEYIEFMAGCASNHRYERGELIVHDGDAAKKTFFIRSGRAEMEIHVPGRGVQTLQSLEDGEMIGWSWLFPPYKWHVDIRAKETTMILALDGTCLRKKLEEDTQLGFDFLRRLIYCMHRRIEGGRFLNLDVYRKEGQES